MDLLEVCRGLSRLLLFVNLPAQLFCNTHVVLCHCIKSAGSVCSVRHRCL